VKRCCVKDCQNKLGNRNKHGYCQYHRHLSPQRRRQRAIIQARFYAKLSDEEKEIRKQRTIAVKDSKRTKSSLAILNYIRSLSECEKAHYFKNKRKAYNLLYEKQRKRKDLNFRIAKNLRSRLSKAITLNVKNSSAVKDLGCSIEDFKIYLESKFQSNMTWDNYGAKGWHIDHIRPLCSFNLSNPEEFKRACHYTNLQPLWWKDNLSKISQDKEIKNGQQMDEENSR
jgi:hypothetical protein